MLVRVAALCKAGRRREFCKPVRRRDNMEAQNYHTLLPTCVPGTFPAEYWSDSGYTHEDSTVAPRGVGREGMEVPVGLVCEVATSALP